MKNIVLVFLLFLSTANLFCQCNTEDNHPEGRDGALELAIYQDFLKSKDYTGALPKWTELYECCNAAFKGKILNDGEKIYKNLTKETDDEKLKKKYALKLVEIQRSRIECYGSKIRKSSGRPYIGYRYYLLGKTYILYLKDYENGVKAFDKAIEYDSVYVEPGLVHLYAYASVKLFGKGKITVSKCRENYIKLMKITDSDIERFKDAKERIDIEYRKIESDPFPCEYFVERLRPIFEDNICDEEFIEDEILNVLRKSGCENEPFFQEVENSLGIVNDCTEDWKIRLDYIGRGHNSFRLGCYENAKRYYELGLKEMYIDSNELAFGAMRLGKLYQKDGEWNEALKVFEYATTLNENSGEPYIAKGLVYLSANKTCEDFERQLVVNIALDNFEKAEQFHDTDEEAREKIKTYKQFLPKKEMLLQKGIPIGQERNVGCILQEKTVIR